MAKLAKKDIISYLKTEIGLSQADAAKAANAVFEYIIERVAAGDEVIVTGFGTFSAAKSAEREATNPNTKEKIQVPAKNRPKFKAGKSFKDAVNKD